MGDARGRLIRSLPLAIAAAALAIYVILLWVNAAPMGNVHTGDTDNLAAGARAAVACLSDGRWTGCGHTAGTRVTAVFPYPLLQYLPAALFVKLGFSDAEVVGALARVNIVAFAGTIALTMWAFSARDRSACRAIAVASIVASSATYQATAGFGEMLAALCVLATVAAAMKRRPTLLAVAALLACTGKETLAPFVLVLGLIAGREDGWVPPRRVWLPLAAGVVGGFSLNSLFNVFRFGSIRNEFYLDPVFRTPGMGRRLLFLAGEWFSPSAGIAMFWPVATAVLVTLAIMALRRLVSAPRALINWAPPVLLLATTVVFTAGLAAWLAPFGWIAYGPRLAVPLLPGAVVAALHTGAPSFERLARRAIRPVAGLATVAVLLVLAGWPQFGAPWSYGAAIDELIAGGSGCPRMTELAVQTDAAQYYRCTAQTMWRLSPLPIDDAATRGGTLATAARAILGLAVVALLVDGRKHRLDEHSSIAGSHEGNTCVPLLAPGCATSST